MKNWCKVMDALGGIFMTKYRADCIEYTKLWNKDSQLRLDDQNFLDLFMGGIYKLDKLNEDYQQSSKPSAKPRLSGVFRKGGSLVSPTVLECIEIGLIKLTIELPLRNRTIFKDVPILLATYEDAPRSCTAVVRTKTMWHQMVLAWRSRKYKIWKVANFCGNECPQKKN